MKPSNLFYLGALSALVLTGCKSNDDNSEWMTDGVVFTSHIEGMASRASGTAWSDGDQVGIFMTAGGTDYENRQYTASSDGNLTPAGQALKYPEEGTADFFAYYPYQTSISNKTYAVNVSDQSDPTKIDLLYATQTGVGHGDVVNFGFTHELSQIVINITKDETINSLSELTIKASGMNTQADFMLGDGTLNAKDSKTDFDMNVKVDGETATAEAIVIPTTDLTGAKLVFTLNGIDFTWDMTVSGGGGFVKGTKYTYNAILSTGNGQPSVNMGNATIDDWTDQAGGNINVDFGDGTQTGEEVVVLDESFANGQGDFTIEDKTKPEELSYVWNFSSGTSSSGDYHYMKASAYVNKTNYAAESWLVSPAVDLTQATTATLTFTHIINFGKDLMSTNQTLWVSEANTENWEQVTIPTYPDGNSWNEAESGDIDLSKYAGKTIKLGFKYVSTTSSAATWEVYNVKVVANGGSGTVDPNPDPEPTPTGSNLLTNPGFEDWTATLPTAWDNASYNTGEIVKETTIKHGGNNSLRQTSESGTNKIQQEVAITSGKKYRISYWFLDNDTKASSRYWFAIVGSDNKTITDINDQIQQQEYSTDNAEWQNVVIQFTAPTGAAKLRYEVRTYRNIDSNEAGGYIYYDDMELTEVQ